MQFRHRTDAGQHLAQALPSLGPRPAVVLALPRGGVPVAAPVAAALGATLDVVIVRKLGAPSQPELAIGAIAEQGVRVLDPVMLDRLRLDDDAVATVEAAERAELQRRVDRYRGGRPLPDVVGRTVVVVDDGLATGATAVAACRAVRTGGPARLVFAVPVGSTTGVERLREEVDDVVCPVVPHRFRAVGQWYADFAQTSDDEVLRLLAGQPVQNPDIGTSR